MEKIKVLNLYAGIGGNRKFWDNVEVTAIEKNPDIAKIYKDFYPEDNVIVTDAHKYLLEHYQEFDFIWSSPPCPTHSRLRYSQKNNPKVKKKYPNMKLYQEIIFLKHFCQCKWVVENVKSYYNPLIKPFECGRHYYWSNFIIDFKSNSKQIISLKNNNTCDNRSKLLNISIKNFYNFKGDKRQLLNNCVEPEDGLEIFNMAFKTKQLTLKNEL